MPKKPNRFERIVDQYIHTDQWNIPVIHASRAVKLLRAEHAWMRRMVNAMYPVAEEMGLSKRGFKDLLLEQLAQHRK